MIRRNNEAELPDGGGLPLHRKLHNYQQSMKWIAEPRNPKIRSISKVDDEGERTALEESQEPTRGTEP